MPTYYVYILKSLKDGTFYKGFTTDYLERFKEHNSGRTRYSSNKRPWELFYVEILSTKKEALIREKT
jgi:putative endonuclease